VFSQMDNFLGFVTGGRVSERCDALSMAICDVTEPETDLRCKKADNEQKKEAV